MSGHSNNEQANAVVELARNLSEMEPGSEQARPEHRPEANELKEEGAKAPATVGASALQGMESDAPPGLTEKLEALYPPGAEQASLGLSDPGRVPRGNAPKRQQPLPSHLVERAQRSFGADLSSVVLVEDPSLKAEGKRGAAQGGSRVRIEPGLTEDDAVLWEELAHIVQQRRGGGDSVASLEDEAEKAAEAGRRGASFPIQGGADGTPLYHDFTVKEAEPGTGGHRPRPQDESEQLIEAVLHRARALEMNPLYPGDSEKLQKHYVFNAGVRIQDAKLAVEAVRGRESRRIEHLVVELERVEKAYGMLVTKTEHVSMVALLAGQDELFAGAEPYDQKMALYAYFLKKQSSPPQQRDVEEMLEVRNKLGHAGPGASLPVALAGIAAISEELGREFAEFMMLPAHVVEGAVNLAINAGVFFYEVWRGFEENVGDVSVSGVVLKFAEMAAMVTVTPLSYLEGAKHGVTLEIEGLSELLEDIGGITGLGELVFELGGLLFVPDGRVLAEAVGYDTGKGFAEDVDRLFEVDALELAHELGIITGPLLVKIVVGVLTGGIGGALLTVVSKLPRVKKILAKIEGRKARSEGGAEISRETSQKQGDGGETPRGQAGEGSERDDGTRQGDGKDSPEPEQKREGDGDRQKAKRIARSMAQERWEAFKRRHTDSVLTRAEVVSAIEKTATKGGFTLSFSIGEGSAKSRWGVVGVAKRSGMKKVTSTPQGDGWIAKGENSSWYSAKDHTKKHEKVVKELDNKLDDAAEPLNSEFKAPEALHESSREIIERESQTINRDVLTSPIRLKVDDDFDKVWDGQELNYPYSIRPNTLTDENGPDLDVRVLSKSWRDRIEFVQNLDAFQGDFSTKFWCDRFFTNWEKNKRAAQIDLSKAEKAGRVVNLGKDDEGTHLYRLVAEKWKVLKKKIADRFEEDARADDLFYDSKEGVIVEFRWEVLSQFCKKHPKLPQKRKEYETDKKMREVLLLLIERKAIEQPKKGTYRLTMMPQKRFLPASWDSDDVRKKYFIRGSSYQSIRDRIADEARDEVVDVIESYFEEAIHQQHEGVPEDEWQELWDEGQRRWDLLIKEGLVWNVDDTQRHSTYPSKPEERNWYFDSKNYHADHDVPLAYLWSGPDEHHNEKWGTRQEWADNRENKLIPMFGRNNSSKNSFYEGQHWKYTARWWVGPDFTGPGKTTWQAYDDGTEFSPTKTK